MRTLVFVVGAVLLLSGCGGAAGQEDNVGGFVDRSGVTVFEPDEREPAPDVDGETLEGEPLALADLDGPVLVNFWASWCGPCVREAPHLRAIAEEYEGQAHVLGVNVKDSRSNAMAFERDFDKPYPSLFDESAAIAASFGGVGPAALPTTMVLDGDHRVAVQLFGAVTAQELNHHLERVLAEDGQ